MKNLDKEDLKTKNIQGILIVPKNFDKKLSAGEDDLVELLIASGIQDNTSIREAVSTSLIQLQSQVLLQQTLEKDNIQLNEAEKKAARQELLLKIDYVKGNEAANLRDSTFSIGILSLFMLIAVLYGTSFIPGPDSRRLRMYRRSTLVKNQSAALLSLTLLWLTELLIFLSAMKVLFPGAFSVNQALLLLIVLCYSLSLSLLVVNLGLRNIAVFLFVPWLILNMTLGGGLWNVPTNLMWTYPLLPVAMALDGQVVMMVSCIIGFLAISDLTIWKRK